MSTVSTYISELFKKKQNFINKNELPFPLLADVLIIQSASAPATAHILQIRTYGGDLKTAGGILFLSYIVCLVAIPGWLAVWKIL